MKFCVILMCFSIFTCSCRKTSNDPVPGKLTPLTGTLAAAGISTPVTGKWQWVQSYHSTTGLTNPALAQYTERLEFGTDSVMKIYRNDLYYYQFKYGYVEDYKYKNTLFDVTMVNGFTYKTVIRNDTLNLSTFDLVDQNEQLYLRIK